MKVTAGDILAEIDRLGKEQPKRPKGSDWRTVAQMAKERNCSITAMRQRMRLALEKGLRVERFVGSDYDQYGTLTKQTWFRVKR